MHTLVEEIVLKSIGEQCSIDISTINTEVPLESLMIDSLSFIQIVVCCEEQLNVEVPDEKLVLKEYNTIGDIVEAFAGLCTNVGN